MAPPRRIGHLPALAAGALLGAGLAAYGLLSYDTHVTRERYGIPQAQARVERAQGKLADCRSTEYQLASLPHAHGGGGMCGDLERDVRDAEAELGRREGKMKSSRPAYFAYTVF